jgi:hypothetical protein
MGLRHVVLGESAEGPLSFDELARRVAQNHAAAAWDSASIDATIRRFRHRGVLRPVADVDAQGDVDEATSADLALLELTPGGREALRSWRRRPSRPAPFRDDVLMNIGTADEEDLAELDGMLVERLRWIVETHRKVTDVPEPTAPSRMSWHEKRKVVARRFDVLRMDGIARGLRRAQSEIRSVQARPEQLR